MINDVQALLDQYWVWLRERTILRQVNDSVEIATPSPFVANLFYEDVVAWLDLSGIRFTPKVKFTGRSGYDHLFDLVVPKSKVQPERILRAISKPSRDTGQSMAFSWIDTREVRAPDSRAYAILNDSELPISGSVFDAMRSYDVRPVLWSEREQMREELSA